MMRSYFLIFDDKQVKKLQYEKFGFNFFSSKQFLIIYIKIIINYNNITTSYYVVICLNCNTLHIPIIEKNPTSNCFQ